MSATTAPCGVRVAAHRATRIRTHRKSITVHTSTSSFDASDHEQRRIRLAQRERLQREQDWQRLLQLRPFL